MQPARDWRSAYALAHQRIGETNARIDQAENVVGDVQAFADRIADNIADNAQALQRQIDANTTRQAEFNIFFGTNINKHSQNFQTLDVVIQDRLGQINKEINLLKGIIENIREHIRVLDPQGLPPRKMSRLAQRKRRR